MLALDPIKVTSEIQKGITDDDISMRTSSEVPRTTVVFPPDPTTNDWMHVVEASGTLEFWNDPDEDKYSE